MRSPTQIGRALALAVIIGAIGGGPLRAQTAPADPPVRLNAGQPPPAATQSASDLAKKLQNPIGDLYSIPFQSNTNFRTGPNRGTQEILNIQPVIPIHLNEDWNIITRTILPLIWQPSFQPLANTVPFGTGPITFSAFLSPAKKEDGWVWGIGPVVQLPTASDPSLGSSVWGAGITGVAVYLKGPWVAGALANNVWSMGGISGRGGTRYNTFLVQPFVNYNFGEGWYVNSAPIITANWLTTGNNGWTLPVGGGVGRVVKLDGKLPINLSLSAYYNVLRPDYGSTWQLRTQLTFIF